MDELLGAFVADCRERLAALESEFSRLARQPDDTDLLASIFRGVHTIKGTCGFLYLSRLHDIAHAIEDVLDRLRGGELVAKGAAIRLMLEALVGITTILDGLDRTGLEPAGDDRALIDALNALAMADVDDDPPRAPAARALPTRLAPASAQVPCDPVAAMSAAMTASRQVEPLERLTAAAGELASAQDRLPKAWRQSAALAPASCLSRIDEGTTGPQASVEAKHVERIGAAWSQLPRLVRHLAIELDKPIELEMHGAEIEIDDCLIEPIKASLVHLVRNAADHGLEGRAERRRCGKREQGRIAVNARRQVDHVVIEVSDDGSGLDTEQITRVAVTTRLVGSADAAAMTTADCQRRIFQPGFSTAETVTPVSGRGVGLDAVRAGIERMGGTIEVCSVPGRGTVFALQVPCGPAKAAAGTVGVDDERRASPGANAVYGGSMGQRTKSFTAKRGDASHQRHPCRPAATARADRKSVVPTPNI